MGGLVKMYPLVEILIIHVLHHAVLSKTSSFAKTYSSLPDVQLGLCSCLAPPSPISSVELKPEKAAYCSGTYRSCGEDIYIMMVSS